MSGEKTVSGEDVNDLYRRLSSTASAIGSNVPTVALASLHMASVAGLLMELTVDEFLTLARDTFEKAIASRPAWIDGNIVPGGDA